MRSIKTIYLLILVLMFILIMSMNIYAMSNPKRTNFPAYPIYPKESTQVRVNSHEIDININNDRIQTATIVNKYNLENTSENSSLLKFIFPFYGSYNMRVLENEITVDYTTYKIFNHRFGIDTKYDFEGINYQFLLNQISYENYEDIYENKSVNVYRINKATNFIDLEVNYNETSTIISNGIDNDHHEPYKIGCHGILTHDILIIDFNKDIEVYLNNDKQEPESNVIFKEALTQLIQYSNDNQLNEQDLNLYYNLLIGHETFTNGIYKFDSFYFMDKLQVNQYEVIFDPGEIKELTVIYDVDPSFYLTKSDRYNTYQLFLNKENWYSYNNISININLNEKYKYLKENSFEVIKNGNYSYEAVIDDASVSIISFSVFTSDEIPEMLSSGWGEAVLLYLLLYYGLPIYIFCVLLLDALIVTIILILNKRKNRLS